MAMLAVAVPVTVSAMSKSKSMAFTVVARAHSSVIPKSLTARSGLAKMASGRTDSSTSTRRGQASRFSRFQTVLTDELYEARHINRRRYMKPIERRVA